MDSNKTAIITGATSGIGSVVAEHLTKKGYNLYILGRSEKKLKATIDNLDTINPEANVKSIMCDLGSMASVHGACEQIRSSVKSIDLLILNAGLWNFQFIETEDKIEETWQVNVLSHALIFEKLISLVPKNDLSKVILTSSGLHQGKIYFDDLEFRKSFSGFKSYRQSKLALLMITRWFAKQEEYNGISFYSVHPGMVNTELGRSAGWLSRSIFKLFGKSKRKGAQTHIYLIDQDPKHLKSGEYYANRRVTKTTAYSYRMDEAEKLWNTVNDYLKKFE